MGDVDVPEVHHQQRRRQAIHDLLGHEERQLVAARRHRRIVEVIEQRPRQRRLQLRGDRAAGIENAPAEALVSLVKCCHHALGQRLPIVDAGAGIGADRRLDRVD